MEDKLVELRQEVGIYYDCGCGVKAWEADYDEFMYQNLKYKLGKHECVGCSLTNGVFEDFIHIIVRAAYPRVGNAILKRYHALRRAYPLACRHARPL